jgi:hypothetical protein
MNSHGKPSPRKQSPTVISKKVLAVLESVIVYAPQSASKTLAGAETMTYEKETDPEKRGLGYEGYYMSPVVFKKDRQLYFVNRCFYGLCKKDFGVKLIFNVAIVEQVFSDNRAEVHLELFKIGNIGSKRPAFKLRVIEVADKGMEIPQFPSARIVFIPCT